MIGVLLFSSVLQVALSDSRDLLDIGTGIFALILFSISLYAWVRRRLNSLVIVAVAFLMFFARTIIQEFLSSLPGVDILEDSLVFVALALFFVAIVVRPRRAIDKATA